MSLQLPFDIECLTFSANGLRRLPCEVTLNRRRFDEFDLTREEAIQLRDWLSEVLGEATYSQAEVDNFVERARNEAALASIEPGTALYTQDDIDNLRMHAQDEEREAIVAWLKRKLPTGYNSGDPETATNRWIVSEIEKRAHHD